MAIMNQIKELEDGTVTVPIFDASVVDDLFRPRLATVDKIGFEVSYRRELGHELGHESGSDYHITIFISDRRIETTDPNDVVFGTWYPRGGKGWAEALAQQGNNRSETILKILGAPDYLQTAKQGTPEYNELMKGFKTDSLSTSPDGPM